MQFKDIIENNELKKQLINSVENNRLSHSQLFLGSAGGPKLAVVIAFAQYINCTNKVNSDSCGECHSCVKYNLLTHPDLHLVFPVLSISGIKKVVSDNFVKEWRREILNNPYLNLHNWFDVFSSENKSGKTGYIYTQESDNLHQKLLLKHYESEYRVVIIWIPEKMQHVTSNKLLKLLEEPPKNTIFLLVSENSELLLNTIVSRLQITKIKDFSIEEKIKTLQNKFSEKRVSDLKKAINFSDGNLGEAIHILDSDILGDDNFDDFQNWMRLCYSVNIQEVVRWVNERNKKGRRNQSIFLKYSLKMVRNCLIIHFSDPKTLNITDNEKRFLSKFHPFIHEGNILEISKKMEGCIKNIERNANSKIMFYELSLQLMRLLKVKRKFVELN
jgi:DNA polymerase-3 subunit delta'